MISITRYAPDLQNWPGRMRLRVAVLSDFHSCRPFMDARRIRAICARANSLRPDIVLLLGDYASGPTFSRPLPLSEWAGALAELSAPLGVHAVLGNHDYEGIGREAARRGPVPIEFALRSAGISVYINDAVRLETGGDGFWLAGLGSQRAFHRHGQSHDLPDLGIDDLAKTLAPVSSDEPVLLMAHEPDIFPDVPARVALTLSGHTHGGQVKLLGRTPVVPSRYGDRYVYGHITEEGRHLIVTSGLGYSNWPLRFATRTEIVLVELGGQA